MCRWPYPQKLSVLLCSDLRMNPSPSPHTHTHTHTLTENLEMKMMSTCWPGTLLLSQAQGEKGQEAAQVEGRCSEGERQKVWLREGG